MLDLLAEIAVRIAAGAATAVVGKAVGAVASRAPARVTSRRVPASPSQIAKWQRSYDRWGERHRFVRDPVRTDMYRGERAGQRIRLLTGVDDGSLKPPEIEVDVPTPSAFPAIVLTAGSPAPANVDIAGRAVVAVLEREGVVQIDVTRRLVRLSFAPMTDPALFDPALDELLRALSPAADSPYR